MLVEAIVPSDSALERCLLPCRVVRVSLSGREKRSLYSSRSSAVNEIVIVGCVGAGRGVVERDFVPLDEPDSRDEDLVPGGCRPGDGDCAAGFTDAESV